MGLPDDEIEDIRWSGLFHDIGETNIAAYILHKPSELTPEEWDITTAHPEGGAELVGKLQNLEVAAKIIIATTRDMMEAVILTG